MIQQWQLDPADASILIIDDEAPNLKLLQKLLNSMGYSDLTLVQDSREVISHYWRHKPDLILLDLNMPYIDGFGVLQLLNELQDPVPPPVIVLTAQSSKEFMLRSLTEGARDFISKPFDRAELQARVRNLLDVHLAHRMVQDQNTVLDELVHQRPQELRETRLQVVERLGRAAEYRDNETGMHIKRMSRYSELLARRLGLSPSECELVLHASPMHDIGKIGIPDGILLKDGKLTHEEFEIIKQHPVIGANILDGDDSTLMRTAHAIALSHHEKWDGSGYPHGLAGEEIPLVARIVSVADVFDALTSVRPYKKAWSVTDAINYLRKNSGVHFDPNVVNAFNDVLADILKVKDKYADIEIPTESLAEDKGDNE